MTSGFIVVIPARYASTRLPGKVLKDIAGKPMIQWVHRQASQSGASRVIVATDDERIAAACRRFGADVELTAAAHASGTDRIAEVARRRAWDERQIVVNVQGDEPLVPPASIAQAARLLAAHDAAAIATLTVPLADAVRFEDRNVVKVVTDRDGWALYYSRAPIPWPRDGGAIVAQRHIGLYAYRAGSLRQMSAAPTCALEEIERLEQLRALHLGLRVIVAESTEPAAPAVDTEDDLAHVRRLVRDNRLSWSD
jgi:3-deoxy-manno-octulosonate cytidylyltransferase (CMP-KDO synthetase)